MKVILPALVVLGVLTCSPPAWSQTIRDEVIEHVLDPCGMADLKELGLAERMSDEEVRAALADHQEINEDFIKMTIVYLQGESFIDRMKHYTRALEDCLQLGPSHRPSEKDIERAWRWVLREIDKKKQGRNEPYNISACEEPTPLPEDYDDLSEWLEDFQAWEDKQFYLGCPPGDRLTDTEVAWEPEPGEPLAQDYDDLIQWLDAHDAWEEQQEKEAAKVLEMNPPRFTDPPACLARGDCFDRYR